MGKVWPMFKRQRWALAFSLILLTALGSLMLPARSATLLPNGKQQFVDGNGKPIAGGKVYFYVPGGTTPKNTWQDAGQTILNANPITIDAYGYAIIYGSGAYRQVVQDSLGNVVWDQLTYDTSASQNSWTGTAGGTTNIINVTAPNFSSQGGQQVTFTASNNNTGPTVLNVNGINIGLLKDLGGGTSSVQLVGGEISAGGIYSATYDPTLGAFHLTAVPTVTGPPATIAASATTNLAGLQTRVVVVSGSGVSITSLGSPIGVYAPQYTLFFQGSNTLVYNSTSMITPTGQNLPIYTGDSISAVYLGAGNWQVLSVSRAFATGFVSSVGYVAKNNATTPNTQFDMGATSLTFPFASFAAVAQTLNLSTVGVNGLDSGTLAANTWYYTFFITDGAQVKVLASTSLTPVLPSGYIGYVRTGAIHTDSSSVLYRIAHAGKNSQYVLTASTNTAAVPAFTSAAVSSLTAYQVRGLGTSLLPPTALIAKVYISSQGFTATFVAPNASYSTTGAPYPPIMFYATTSAGSSGFGFVSVSDIVLESNNLYYQGSSAPSMGGIFGWTDAVGMN